MRQQPKHLFHLIDSSVLRNFANPLMMSPCHRHLILLSPVHPRHHHHFHYASFLLSSTSDSKLKLTFSTSPSHRSPSLLPLRTDLTVLRPLPDLINLSFFCFLSLLLAFLFDSYDGLSGLNPL